GVQRAPTSSTPPAEPSMEAFPPRSFESIPSAPAVDPTQLAPFVASLPGTAAAAGAPDFAPPRATPKTRSDRTPPPDVRAADAADVSRTVTLAVETGLELAVRSGGHSLAGHSTSQGGIVLDLSRMKGLLIDPDRRLAWAQPGLTAGEVTAAAA